MTCQGERHIKIVIEYDGTHFAGFQRQAHQRTVQGVLETAIAKVVKHPVKVLAAGRTDAGVHATGQVAKFTTVSRIPVRAVVPALNSNLPFDIVVKSATLVNASFHPRYDAKSRVYRYTIDNKRTPSVLLRNYAWHIPDKLDVTAMKRAAVHLIGTHDFKSFHASGSDLGSTVRCIYDIQCRRKGGLVIITIEANAFLYHMARIIVGTLVEIGLGKRKPSDMKCILNACNRDAAGPTAPAHGLCLVRVRY
ncbi:MAG TPA: tRNA pseudouridine(38-40) synthase TruA [Armatimonadetes bacterium]|nr:tRNA pseudouridine(38-40) synthase TruA [Armatimonadota bacterium]